MERAIPLGTRYFKSFGGSLIPLTKRWAGRGVER